MNAAIVHSVERIHGKDERRVRISFVARWNFYAEINQLFFIEKKFDLILQEKNLGLFYEQR